jgi:hypothetical protein
MACVAEAVPFSLTASGAGTKQSAMMRVLSVETNSKRFWLSDHHQLAKGISELSAQLRRGVPCNGHAYMSPGKHFQVVEHINNTVQ